MYISLSLSFKKALNNRIGTLKKGLTRPILEPGGICEERHSSSQSQCERCSSAHPQCFRCRAKEAEASQSRCRRFWIPRWMAFSRGSYPLFKAFLRGFVWGPFKGKHRDIYDDRVFFRSPILGLWKGFLLRSPILFAKGSFKGKYKGHVEIWSFCLGLQL